MGSVNQETKVRIIAPDSAVGKRVRYNDLDRLSIAVDPQGILRVSSQFRITPEAVCATLNFH